MKGVVFTEFVEFVIDQMGDSVADEMFEVANLPSGGAYTAVGYYDHRELIDLVAALSGLTKRPAPDLIRAFGRHLFTRFQQARQELFETKRDSFTFIESIELEVRAEFPALYPAANAPRLETAREAPDALLVRYVSCRPLAELCAGMISGCGDHFGERLEMSLEPDEIGSTLRVTRVAEAA